jgi:hypothetical protein
VRKQIRVRSKTAFSGSPIRDARSVRWPFISVPKSFAFLGNSSGWLSSKVHAARFRKKPGDYQSWTEQFKTADFRNKVRGVAKSVRMPNLWTQRSELMQTAEIGFSMPIWVVVGSPAMSSN